MPSTLSVLFATHNGARWIERTLDAYVAQDYPHPWQLVVVDNASTDDTYRIVERYLDKLPLTLLSETRVGKNRALNTGMASIHGDLIILTDDDAPPRAGFLEAWAKLEHLFPEHDLFGGRVEAQFETPPPVWIKRLTQQSEAVFAQRNLPTGEIPADEIFGPNMCVRRRVFDAGLTFNENIGPNGTDSNYPMGSETEFCRRVEAAGFKAMFFAEPNVGHIVRPNQMTFAYFQKVAYRSGRRDAMMAFEAGTLASNLWSAYRLRRHAPAWLQEIWLKGRAWLALDPVKRNFRWWRYYAWKGYMDEARDLRRTADTA